MLFRSGRADQLRVARGGGVEIGDGDAEVVDPDRALHARQPIGGRSDDALEARGVFPSVAVKMAEVGESTGALQEMLNSLADFYDEEVDAAVGGLLSLLEPVMIVFLGVVVGGMVVAMYLPIFDMVNNVQ